MNEDQALAPSPLAEIGVAYEEIFKALPDIHAVSEPMYLRSNFIHGIKHLRAEFTPTSLRKD